MQIEAIVKRKKTKVKGGIWLTPIFVKTTAPPITITESRIAKIGNK